MACNDCNDENITDIPVGPQGPQGIQGIPGDPGVNAFGLTTGIATSLGSGLYSIPMSGVNNAWIVVDQIVYIAGAGYYIVTSITAGVSTTVQDPISPVYTGNTPSYMLSNSNLKVSPAGIMGPTGATGVQGPIGPMGPTGPAGTLGSLKRIPSQTITTTHNVTINPPLTNAFGVSVPITFSGFISLSASAVVVATVSVYNDGNLLTDFTTVNTMPPLVSGVSRLTIPVFCTTTINATKTVTIQVTLSSYVGTFSITNGALIVVGNL